jgi:hypothetical protein
VSPTLLPLAASNGAPPGARRKAAIKTPAQLWHDEVLAPQFRYEVANLLPWYLAIEKVLLPEYVRMGLADPVHAGALAGQELDWDRERMARLLGLTVRAGLPWRTAQVVAGRYVVAATERGLPPSIPDGELLAELVAAVGGKRSAGSVNPAAVTSLLAAHEAEYAEIGARWDGRHAATRDVLTSIDAMLSSPASTA